MRRLIGVIILFLGGAFTVPLGADTTELVKKLGSQLTDDRRAAARPIAHG